MEYQTNEKGKEIIKKYEGCKLTAYRCPKGILTIGWGHTGADVTEGLTISQKKADELFNNDLKRFETAIKNNVKLPLNINQFSALVSFTYNCGISNLKKLVKNRNLEQISTAILLYNQSGGKKLNGLVKRRKAERELFCQKVS